MQSFIQQCLVTDFFLVNSGWRAGWEGTTWILGTNSGDICRWGQS